MKKSADFLLFLPLLLVIIFIALTFRSGTLSNLFAAKPVSTESIAPTVISYVTPFEPATIIQTYTSTLTPSPSLTPTPTKTNTPTPTTTPSPTQTVANTATATLASEEINNGIIRGNEIVQALESYYLARAHYPAVLDELVPVYLPALSVTSTGQPYFYRTFDAAHPMASEIYWLTFRVLERENTVCTYLRRLQYWDCTSTNP